MTVDTVVGFVLVAVDETVDVAVTSIVVNAVV